MSRFERFLFLISVILMVGLILILEIVLIFGKAFSLSPEPSLE